MSDLLAIGEALVELNQPREGAPFVQGFGGDTSNAMIAAARLGADAAYFTAVGADAFGQALTALWLKEGVDASRIVVNGGAHTGLYFVTHGPEGHAFSYMRAGSAASRVGESDLPIDRIRATKILHASGISQAISSSAADAVFAAIDVARDAKRLVSYDPNLRLKLWPLRRARAIIHEAMNLCDIALPGLDDGLALTTSREAGRDRRFLLTPWRACRRIEARQSRRRRRDRQKARTHRRTRGRGGRCDGGGRLFRRRLSRRICSARRSFRRRTLRQCRGGLVDAGVRRRRPAAAPRRRRGGDGGVTWAEPSVRAFTARAFGANFTQMDLSAFRASLDLTSPSPDLSHALRALWLDARGDWDGAHEAAQADEGGDGDWVHAYLHRKEGDAGNAAYWYRRAGKPVCRTSLDEEWEAIASALLRGHGGRAA